MSEAMIEEIHAVNRELIAAGVRKFACGISPAASAKTLRKQSDGKVLITDGPYTETKEHIGGFWILECGDMEEAAWARKGRITCDAVGEVRELLFFPAPQPGSGGSKLTLWPGRPQSTRYWKQEERAGATLCRRFHRSVMRRRTMKYICLGYYDKGNFDALPESERNAMFDACFEYDDHLRANGHSSGGEALQPPETA